MALEAPEGIGGPIDEDPRYARRVVPDPLRQLRVTHQVAVALARRPPAFVDGPHHQALPAAHVAGREYAPYVRRKLPVLRLGVGALVLLHAELIEELTLRPAEAKCQEHEL